MRHFLRLLVVTTMVMPIGIGAAQHSASADPGTNCSSISGSSTIAPGFQKLDPAGPSHYAANDAENDVGTLEKNQTITSSGTISGCSGGGVTGGTFTNSVINNHDPSDCNDLLRGGPTPAGWGLIASPGSAATLTDRPPRGSTTSSGPSFERGLDHSPGAARAPLRQRVPSPPATARPPRCALIFLRSGGQAPSRVK